MVWFLLLLSINLRHFHQRKGSQMKRILLCLSTVFYGAHAAENGTALRNPDIVAMMTDDSIEEYDGPLYGNSDRVTAMKKEALHLEKNGTREKREKIKMRMAKRIPVIKGSKLQ